jgi:hypothetical protein
MRNLLVPFVWQVQPGTPQRLAQVVVGSEGTLHKGNDDLYLPLCRKNYESVKENFITKQRDCMFRHLVGRINHFMLKALIFWKKVKVLLGFEN